MAASWETIRDECLGRRQAAIPKEYLLPDALLQKLPTQSFPRDLSNVVDTASHFTEAEIRIVNAPARTILSNVKDGAWSSVEVTQAFCKAAAVANQLVCTPLDYFTCDVKSSFATDTAGDMTRPTA